MNGRRKTYVWEWAKEWAELFESILPADVCETAMATCQFVIQGPESVGAKAKNWGKWIRTQMQTYGHLPCGVHAQIKGNWISSDSHDAANVILGCMDLTMDDVYDAFVVPGEGEKFTVSLHDVVMKCYATAWTKEHADVAAEVA